MCLWTLLHISANRALFELVLYSCVEVATRGVLSEKVFLEISQITTFRKNTSSGLLLLVARTVKECLDKN